MPERLLVAGMSTRSMRVAAPCRVICAPDGPDPELFHSEAPEHDIGVHQTTTGAVLLYWVPSDLTEAEGCLLTPDVADALAESLRRFARLARRRRSN